MTDQPRVATGKVKEAGDHVRQFHPEVIQIFYGVDGRWLFCGEGFEIPTFLDKQVDIGLLEDAADEVANNVGFPAAFWHSDWKDDS